MCRHYYELRVSDTFKKDWDTFLEQTIDHTASPTFYQFISHRLFQEFIKRRHQIAENEDCIANPLSREDENALRYVAGYVCRKVQAKLKSFSHPHKEDMILFISDFSGDGMKHVEQKSGQML